MKLVLPASLAAWCSPEFAAVFKRELEDLGAEALPLQQCVVSTSMALDDRLEVLVLGADGQEDQIRVKAGVFFAGIVAGCSCADDPTPVEAQTEYCELVVTIDRRTGEAAVTPVS